MRIAICDDEALDRIQLEETIRLLAKKEHFDCTIDAFSDAETFLESAAVVDYDMVYLDIYMDGKNGIEAAKALPPRFRGFIIFTTTSPDFALEAIDLNAVHYLIKPVTLAKLEEVYVRCVDRNHTSRQEPVLEVLSERKKMAIPQETIDYIESHNKFAIIHCGVKTFKTYDNLSLMRDQLLPALFISPHRSFIINMGYIDGFQKSRITLKDGRTIAVSRNVRDTVADAYTEYLAGLLRGKG